MWQVRPDEDLPGAKAGKGKEKGKDGNEGKKPAAASVPQGELAEAQSGSASTSATQAVAEAMMGTGPTVGDPRSPGARAVARMDPRRSGRSPEAHSSEGRAEPSTPVR